ncbi:hypothetical protein DPEC_G00199940 [Dallia pectoralis]|uniref:Uncharacterized protein n=1 Tax=Dallia pectoralis TaxID=75939 RepID=A0ACC2G873_DALPE|nr:hypothetical protein DPEC_G00199940 [Dallia pectoralis]
MKSELWSHELTSPPPPTPLSPSVAPSIARKQAQDLSYSEMDLRAKPKRFGTFTFGLKRKKKSERDHYQSVMVLHSPEPKVKGQEKGQPLDLSTWDHRRFVIPNKSVTVSQPDLATKNLLANDPCPTIANQSLAREPSTDSSKTVTDELQPPILTSQSKSRGKAYPLQARKLAPLALPEVESDDGSADEDGRDVPCYKTYSSTAQADASLMDPGNVLPPPSSQPSPSPQSCLSNSLARSPSCPLKTYPPASPNSTSDISNQRDDLPHCPSTSSDSVRSGFPDSVDSDSGSTPSLTQEGLSNTTVSNVTCRVPAEDCRAAVLNPNPALDPSSETTTAETDITVPEVETVTPALNLNTLTDALILKNDSLTSKAVPSVTDRDVRADANITDDTAFPYDHFISSDDSSASGTVAFSASTADNVSHADLSDADCNLHDTLSTAATGPYTSRGSLDTNRPMTSTETDPQLPFNNPFDSATCGSPEPVEQEFETANNYSAHSFIDATQSTPFGIAPDATVVSQMDASHHGTDTTASHKTHHAVTHIDTEPLFKDLYNSFFPNHTTYLSQSVITTGTPDSPPPNTGRCLEETVAPVSLHEATLRRSGNFGTQSMEMDGSVSGDPASDSEISIADTSSTDTNEAFYDCLLPESFSHDQWSPISDKQVYIMETATGLLPLDCDTRPSLVGQSTTSAFPVRLETDNPNPVLPHYDLALCGYDQTSSDDAIVTTDVSHYSRTTENSTSLESTECESFATEPVRRNSASHFCSPIAETMDSEGGPQAELEVTVEEDRQIGEAFRPCVLYIVRKRSSEMSTVPNEEVHEAAIMEEDIGEDSDVRIEGHVSIATEVIKASSRYATTPENSHAADVSMSQVRYGIPGDYSEEISVAEVKADGGQETDEPHRNGNETGEVEWSVESALDIKEMSDVDVESAQLHTEEDPGRGFEDQKVEKPNNHYPGERGAYWSSQAVEREWKTEPALPVQPAYTFEECESSDPLPGTEPRGEEEMEEGSRNDRSTAVRVYLETEARPKTYTFTHNPGKDELPLEGLDEHRIHNATGDTETSNALALPDTVPAGEENVLVTEVVDFVTCLVKDAGSPCAESSHCFPERRVKDDTAVTESAESRSRHTVETDRDETVTHTPQAETDILRDSPEWIDCIVGRNPKGAGAGLEQAHESRLVTGDIVLDRLQRDSGLFTEGTESPGVESEQLGVKLSEDNLSHPGYLDASAVLSTASESSEDSSIQKASAAQESDGEMQSYSSTLIIKPSPSHDGLNETKQRFRKVSLVTTSSTADHNRDNADHGGSSIPEPNNTEVDLGPVTPEHRHLYPNNGATFDPNGVSFLSASQSDESRKSACSEPNSRLPSLPTYTQHHTSPALRSEELSSLSSGTSGSPGDGFWLSDGGEVQLSRESSVPQAETGIGRRWRGEEEPVAPAVQRERVVEQEREEGDSATERIKLGSDSQPLPVSSFSSQGQSAEYVDYSFSTVYKATRVELLPDTSPDSPVTSEPGSPCQNDMEILVDTLKSMNPPQMHRSLRGMTSPSIFSSLPPIVEDAPCYSPTRIKSPGAPAGSPQEGANSVFKFPEDLGLKLRTHRELRSPLEQMKLQRGHLQSQQAGQQQDIPDGLNLPLRQSAISSILQRKSSVGSDSSPEGSSSPQVNGGSSNPSPSLSRLDNSILFSSYRSASTDQPKENGKAPNLASFSQDRMSSETDIGMAGGLGSGQGSGGGTGIDLSIPPRYDRFSLLMSGSLTGNQADSNSRMSGPPLSSFISALGDLHSPSSTSVDIHRSFANSIDSQSKLIQGSIGSIGLGLQRSFSSEGLNSPLFNIGSPVGGSVHGGSVHGELLHGGSLHEGSVYGGSLHGGSVHGGSLRGESVHGGSLHGGSVHGGSLRGESVHGGSLHGGSVYGGSHVSPEPEMNLVPKYRAFPDAYLTKEKEHGKLNPRPGKMYVFDQPGMCGQRFEVRSDIVDATPWELQETISIRVVRGGWVLYEKPNFKGEKIALHEGDIEITYPFSSPEMENPPELQQNGEEEEGGEEEAVEEAKPVRRFVIGSIRRAVRDYSVPEISLFPEENAEGKKVTFRDTSDDARIFGFPIKANSIIINAGLWLVYAQPFFQGAHRVLEVGGYPNPASWGVEQPYVGSVHPLKIAEPKVEKPNEPKLVLYEKAYFTGKTRTIYTNMRDFVTRLDKQQLIFMYSAGSIKVLGGCWVGYEKEGFRGHQYLLEEGEYHDWRVWGGHNAELRSVRVLRADLTEPMLVLYEQPDENLDTEENTFEVTEAIPDVELFGFRTSTRSIHVHSGAWIAYSHVDFSGDQYILEKGFYNNCADWGSCDNRVCSVQPILLAPSQNQDSIRSEVILYTEPDFQGGCHVCDKDQEALPDQLVAKSCRVLGGSWVMYEGRVYSGNLYVLSEGDYPNFTSMACPPNCVIRSLKSVPLTFSVPSISLFGLECFEGREITVDTEVADMLEEGYNNHILSVRVNRGSWVLCEHSNYRGRQFLLEPIEITNWSKYSHLVTVGSIYPIRQRRRFFRIKNTERGHFISIQGGVEEMKSGRVVATEQVEGESDLWFYQDGLIKNKLAVTMCLQVMGNVEAGSKLVLWSETRQPIQTWTAQISGTINSLTFPGMVLGIKGGKQYDRDHIVIQPASEERPCQQWELELL